MSKLSTIVIGLALLVGAGCSNNTGAFSGSDASQLSTHAREGDDPGECSDGADNDGNGFFDCDDQACWNSPACKGRQPVAPTDTTLHSPAVTDAVADSQSSADAVQTTQPDVVITTPDLADATPTADLSPVKPTGLSQLTSVSLTYTQAVDFQGNFAETNCASYGICDCTNVFVGSGTQHALAADRVTFKGVWKLQSSDCHAEIQGGLTWTDASGTGYHTIVFSQGISVVDAWIAHFKATATEPLSQPKKNEQWYIYQMNASFDGAALTVDHTESESDYSDPLAPAKYTHTLHIEFNQ